MNNFRIRHWLGSQTTTGKPIWKMEDSPRHIAGGYSLGLFIGLLPLVGIKAIMAVGIASLLKWNRPAAALGVFNINPITAPFFFGLSYLAGKEITGCQQSFRFSREISVEFLTDIYRNAPEILLTLAAGSIIIGLPLAFFTYHLSYLIIRKYRKQ